LAWWFGLAAAAAGLLALAKRGGRLKNGVYEADAEETPDTRAGDRVIVPVEEPEEREAATEAANAPAGDERGAGAEPGEGAEA
jgi:hypothetical protein